MRAIARPRGRSSGRAPAEEGASALDCRDPREVILRVLLEAEVGLLVPC